MERPLYEYDAEKNIKLLKERGVSFEDIIAILDDKGALAIIDHPNKSKYPHQKIYVVNIESYIYLVPFERCEDKAILKTIFPSRKMTRLYGAQLFGGSKV